MVKNTCAICLPAAAGTEIARRFQRIPSRFSPSNKVYSKSAFVLSFTKYRPVRREPIAEYSALLPPKEIGPCLSSDVAVDSLEPTMDQWLGWAFTPPTTLNPEPSHPQAVALLSGFRHSCRVPDLWRDLSLLLTRAPPVRKLRPV